MSRSAKLIFVEGNTNHNKIYNMVDNGSQLTVEWGRVGSTLQTTTYPSSKWSSLYSSKIKKGYKDVTELFTVAPSASTVDFLDISDVFISKLITKLESYTKRQVSNNYLVTADTVTRKQVEEAQQILTYLLKVKSNRELNKHLLELFSVIPRKMKKVGDHLASESSDFDYGFVEQTIASEQELLDSMAQQVQQAILVKENVDDKKTLLDAMGIEIFNVRDDQEQMIKNKLGQCSDKFIRGFRIENKRTKEKFDNYISKKNDKTTTLLWHGTRNPSVLPILQSGLLIRPSGAVHTGSMFDDGIYGANKALKSYGYTSGKGSYWANGNSNEAFMFLFEFHIGKQYVIERWESWMQKISKSDRFKGYDSVYAKGGYDLKNDEFVVYSPDAVTCKYLVELR